MKSILFCLILSVATSASADEHHFVFQMKNSPKSEIQTFEFSSTAPTYESAFERAAQACYRHFKAGQRLTEERGLDIIDACANPRERKL